VTKAQAQAILDSVLKSIGQGFAGARGAQSGQWREDYDRCVKEAFFFDLQGGSGFVKRLMSAPDSPGPVAVAIRRSYCSRSAAVMRFARTVDRFMRAH
jgi:hypothetical protein